MQGGSRGRHAVQADAGPPRAGVLHAHRCLTSLAVVLWPTISYSFPFPWPAGVITDIIHDPGRGAPLARVRAARSREHAPAEGRLACCRGVCGSTLDMGLVLLHAAAEGAAARAKWLHTCAVGSSGAWRGSGCSSGARHWRARGGGAQQQLSSGQQWTARWQQLGGFSSGALHVAGAAAPWACGSSTGGWGSARQLRPPMRRRPREPPRTQRTPAGAAAAQGLATLCTVLPEDALPTVSCTTVAELIPIALLPAPQVNFRNTVRYATDKQLFIAPEGVYRCGPAGAACLPACLLACLGFPGCPAALPPSAPAAASQAVEQGASLPPPASCPATAAVALTAARARSGLTAAPAAPPSRPLFVRNRSGQYIYCGKKATLNIGNVKPVGDMPEGTIVCNVEEKAGDRGSLARCSGEGGGAHGGDGLALWRGRPVRMLPSMRGSSMSACVSVLPLSLPSPPRTPRAYPHHHPHRHPPAQATTPSSWRTTPTPASRASSCPAAPRRCLAVAAAGWLWGWLWPGFWCRLFGGANRAPAPATARGRRHIGSRRSPGRGPAAGAWSKQQAGGQQSS